MRIGGQRVSLRSIQENDFPSLWELMYGEDNPEWKRWDAPYYPHARVDFGTFQDQIYQRLARATVPPMLLIECGDQIIGVVTYYWEDPASWWLELGIVIYRPPFWNGGFGTEALYLWIDYLFQAMPLVRVGLTTWSGNGRMIRCAEKLVMQMEGRIRKVRRYNEDWYDSIRMGILREEWDRAQQHL